MIRIFYSLCSIVGWALMLGGCKGFVQVAKPDKKEKPALTQTSTTPDVGSPLNMTISSSQELISVSTDLTSAFAAPATGPLATTNNIIALNAPPGLTGPIANTNTPQGPAAPAAYQSAINANATTPQIVAPYATYNASITSTASFSSNVTSTKQSCGLNSPYTSVSCAIGTFTIPSSLFTNAAFYANAYVSDVPTNKVASNSLTPKSYNFKQLTNLSTDDDVKSFAGLSDYVYYQAKNAAGFYKAFRTNGSTVEQISDTRAGADDTISYGFMEYNGYLYFASNYTATETFKMTRTNGTTLERLSNNNVNASDGIGFPDAGNGIVCNNTLFLMLLDSGGPFGAKFGSFDGLTQRQISNLSGVGATDINIITRYFRGCVNSRMYIGGSAGANNRLYSSDGTDFKQISNTSAGANDRVRTFYTSVNSKILFQGSIDGTANGEKLNITDGTSVNAESNTCAGCADSNWPNAAEPFQFASGELFFIALKSAAGFTKLYSHDGTTLKQLSDTCSGCSDNVSVLGATTHYTGLTYDAVYFSSVLTSGFNKLFKTDGNTITQISNTNPSGSDAPTLVGYLGKYLFVTLSNAAGFTKLYSYDGSTLQQLSDLNSGGNDTIYKFNSSNLFRLKSERIPVFDGRFYFMAKDSAGANHLYSSNGSDLMQMTGFNTANGGEFIANGACAVNAMMIVNNSKAYFSGVRTDAVACNDHLFVLTKN